MKKAYRLIWWILAGEILTLFYKDNSFKRKLSLAKWPDKVKLLFKSLVDLNRNVFLDVKEYDYEWKITEFKDYFEKEYKILEKKVKELGLDMKSLSQEKVEEVIKNLKKKIMKLKEMAEESIEDVMEKYEVQEKIDDMVSRIKEIEKNIEKSVKNATEKAK